MSALLANLGRWAKSRALMPPPTYAGIYCNHGPAILCERCKAELDKHRGEAWAKVKAALDRARARKAENERN